MRQLIQRKRKGFTLVELIIVIGVLAILAVSAIMIVGDIRSKAALATEQSNANAIVRVVNTYNALSKNSIDIDSIDAYDLRYLKLESSLFGSSSETDLNLGVSITDDEFEEAVKWIGSSNGMLHVLDQKNN